MQISNVLTERKITKEFYETMKFLENMLNETDSEAVISAISEYNKNKKLSNNTISKLKINASKL